VLPTGLITNTDPFGFGFQAEIRPSARTWARLVRGTPPIRVKVPPTKNPPAPSLASAEASPSTRGMATFRAPVVASTTARVPVYGPRDLNSPPR